MNKIVIITYFDDTNREFYKELKKRGVIEKLYTPDEINESKVILKIDSFSPNTTILIHSSNIFNIDRENIYYFSFGCQNCKNEKQNGYILKDIIENIDKYNIEEINNRFKEFKKSIDYKEAKNFLSNYKDRNNIKYKIDNTLLYISDILSMPLELKLIFEKIKKISTKEEIIKRLELDSEDYLYLLVPFMGYGYPRIDSLNNINRYFLDLKKLQELSNYRIIFLFLAYNNEYIPDFFKDGVKYKSKIHNQVDITFISPLKKFNQDNHIKFIFAELIYKHNEDGGKKEVLNFFRLDKLSNSSIVSIVDYLKKLHNYKEIKQIYYNNLFLNEKYTTDKAISEYRECWNKKLELQYHDIKENFHDFDLPDIRTNMPFYLASIFNKLLLIENTLKSQKIDFLLIDDEDTIKDKESSIINILNILLGENNYIFSKKLFNRNNFHENIETFILSTRNKNKDKNIRNSNFILLDFILDKDGLFFGSDFVEKVEKYKKRKDKLFRTWYFITSFLSGYINKFEMDKILYEYYETTNVQLGDSTQEKHRIFFIKKLVYFIYSKINIYIRIHDISKKIILSKENTLIKKLIILMQDLLKQIDLLELRYGENNLQAPQQFYTLTISILDDYLQKIEYQWEIREIKYQELKRIKEKLNPKNNQEVNQVFLLIQTLYFIKKEG